MEIGIFNTCIKNITTLTNTLITRSYNLKIAEKDEKLQYTLEQNRQQFELKKLQATNEFQNKLSIQEQKHNLEIAEKTQKLQYMLEQNREQFELKKLQATNEFQNKLNIQQHEYRLQEQNHNFDLLCKSEEWKTLLEDWPLNMPPIVVRDFSKSENGKICLQVFLAKSNNETYNKRVYPYVEQGLKDFTDYYTNVLHSENLIFHCNCFKKGYEDGTGSQNLFCVLKQLPVVFIDTKIIGNMINISLILWGFDTKKKQFTAISLPFEDSKEELYYSQLAKEILAYLKILIGYTYDMYELTKNSSMPLLPYAIKHDEDFKDRVTSYIPLKSLINISYMDLYKNVLGNSSDNSQQLQISEMHLLRLQYAKILEEYLEEEEFANCLHDSLISWSYLRSKNQVGDFLQEIRNDISNDNLLLKKYFGKNDIVYFDELKRCIQRKELQAKGGYANIWKLVLEINKKLVKWQQNFRENLNMTLPVTNIINDNSPSSEIEAKKIWLTEQASHYIDAKNYVKAAQLLGEIAKICHTQKKEKDAYYAEHKAFLCNQMEIYKKAKIEIDIFDEVPYVEILKCTLSKMADLAFKTQAFHKYWYYKTLTAKLCRAQGKDNDAYLLDTSADMYKDIAIETMEKQSDTIPKQEQEKQMLEALVEPYRLDFEKSEKGKR